jgi:hypothetical protein
MLRYGHGGRTVNLRRWGYGKEESSRDEFGHFICPATFHLVA